MTLLLKVSISSEISRNRLIGTAARAIANVRGIFVMALSKLSSIESQTKPPAAS